MFKTRFTKAFAGALYASLLTALGCRITPLCDTDPNACPELGEDGNTDTDTDTTTNTDADTTDTEDDTTDTEDDIGETDADTTDTEDDTGETEGGTGETEEGTGETEGGTGETEDDTGETEGGTGETEGGTGETEGGTGETEGGTGETEGDTGGELPIGAACTANQECASGSCYIVPFLGGQCGECDEDADCDAGGCSPPNPFEILGSTCNMGELGGGCESTDVCADDLVCDNVADLFGLLPINSCSTCEDDDVCTDGQICAPLVTMSEFSGFSDCIDPGSVEQDGYCTLEGNGDDACMSGICSTIDIMGQSELGACGECNDDGDCDGGTCVPGEFTLNMGNLSGSTCQ